MGQVLTLDDEARDRLRTRLGSRRGGEAGARPPQPGARPTAAEVAQTLRRNLPLTLSKAEVLGALWVATTQAEQWCGDDPATMPSFALEHLCRQIFGVGLTDAMLGWAMLGEELGVAAVLAGDMDGQD